MWVTRIKTSLFATMTLVLLKFLVVTKWLVTSLDKTQNETHAVMPWCIQSLIINMKDDHNGS